jgi:hypothetical protein
VSQQINLFNPVFLKQRKVFTALAMARALGLLLAGALAVGFYARQNVAGLQREADSGRDLLAKREQRLAKVKTDFAPRQKSAALEGEMNEARSRLQALRDVSGVLDRGELGNTQGYSEYFKALARQNISGVWLTGVSISGAGAEIGVQGRALDAALVPAYLGRLTHEQVMRGKAFGSLKINQPASAKDAPAALAPYVEFSLESTLVEAAK